METVNQQVLNAAIEEEIIDRVVQCRAQINEIIEVVRLTCGDPRAIAIARTKLDEFEMWLYKAMPEVEENKAGNS